MKVKGSSGIRGAFSCGSMPALLAAVAVRVLAGVLVSVGVSYSALPPGAAQDLTGEVHDEQDKPVAGAVCTLTGPVLPEGGLPVTTDELGHFAFPGLAPGAYSLTCAAVGYQPVAKNGIEIIAQGLQRINREA